jgi:two-component system sensor histidine kinase CpxA
MRSLFLKIFLWFWFTMVLIALAFVFIWNLESDTNPSRQSMTGDAVALYAASAAQVFEANGAQGANNFLRQLNQTSRIRAVLLDNNLHAVAGQLENGDPTLLQSVVSTGQTQIDVHGDFAFAATIAETPSSRKYVLAAELPRRAPGIFRGSLKQQLLRWLIAILISGLVCYTLTRYLTQPVLRLRSAASNIAAGDFSARAAPRLANRRDEMGELVRDFNQMAERIQSLMDAQQQLLRDISHELRSPLARLNVALGLARKWAGDQATSALDRIEQESERLNEMIGRLLTLAKIKTLVDPPQHTSVSLRGLADQIAEDARFEANEKHCEVHVAGAEDCEVRGSHELLHSAIENVIRNAVRHAPAETVVQIDLKCDGERSRILVRDHGPGVPAGELSKIFRPFYRLSDSREHRSGGTGIGLAITHEIVRLHGGSVSARNAQPNGLIVEIELPRPKPS